MGKQMMRSLVFLLCLFVVSASAAADDNLGCDIGPVAKTFGGTPWLVYSCKEDRHLMFVSAPNSPAGQAIFMLFWDSDHWTVMDLGMGKKSAVEAMRRDLQSLPEPAILDLIEETKHH